MWTKFGAHTDLDLLICLKVPFIDVSMGLNRKRGPLAGISDPLATPSQFQLIGGPGGYLRRHGSTEA